MLFTHKIPVGWRRASAVVLPFLLACAVLGAVPMGPAFAAGESVAELRTRIEAATRDFRDLSALVTVTYKNKDALAKVDSAYSALYDFKSARLQHKQPDKIRLDGKLGMVKFEYIMNGTVRMVRAPTVRVKTKKDYAHDPAKTQTALDLGLVTPSIWTNRKVEVVEDEGAKSCEEIKLALRWPNNTRVIFIWLDARDLYLKRFEKRGPDNELILRAEYSEPRKAGGVVWIPTRVDVYGADGEKVGSSEVSDIKVNTGLPDSLFE